MPTPESLYAHFAPGVKEGFDRQYQNYLTDPDTYDNPWEYIEDYNIDTSGSKTPEELVPEEGEEGTKKARLSLSSTSTIDPESPRTLSAGYDAETHIMTIQFRDGTLWNYYDVPEEIWSEFENAESKGRYLKASGLDDWHSMGPAEGSTTSWFKKRAKRASEQQKTYGGMQIGRTRK